MISTPGATTSGLIRSSLVGPEPEKLAMWPFASVAPTVMTFTPSPGESIKPGGRRQDDWNKEIIHILFIAAASLG